MAQTSSVQREPSIEEILASIRRIIEENEPARKDEAIEARKNASTVGTESFRAQLNRSADASPIVSWTGPEKFENPSKDDESPSTPLYDGSQERQHKDEPVLGPKDSLSEGSPAPYVPPKENQGEEKEDSQSAGLQLSDSSDPLLWEKRESVKPADPHQRANTLASSLVSQAAEQRMMLAFEELSKTFEVNQQKDFPRLAEQMLRPMLHDWLENNLPQLVERLVRETIERTARGRS